MAAMDDQLFLTRSIEVNREGLIQYQNAFELMGLGHIPSVGNFITVDVQRSGAEVYDALLHLGVIVRPLANYKMPNHLRVTVGTKQENSRCIEAMKQVLQR